MVDIITATMDNRFHEVIKGVYEKHLITDIWDDLTLKSKLIENSGIRLMANSGRVDTPTSTTTSIRNLITKRHLRNPDV